MKKKTLALVLALTLVVVGVVSGTLAWLTAKSDTVINTFTTSDIKVKLEETKTVFKMVPGCTIDKDPVATVEANSEKCYLFVKLEKANNLDSYISYEMADGWRELTKGSGVYYRVVDTSKENQEFPVLKGNKVSVKGEVTKDMMATAKTSQPTMTFTVYAAQYMKSNTEHFTEVEAWGKVNPTTTP